MKYFKYGQHCSMCQVYCMSKNTFLILQKAKGTHIRLQIIPFSCMKEVSLPYETGINMLSSFDREHGKKQFFVLLNMEISFYTTESRMDSNQLCMCPIKTLPLATISRVIVCTHHSFYNSHNGSYLWINLLDMHRSFFVWS